MFEDMEIEDKLLLLDSLTEDIFNSIKGITDVAKYNKLMQEFYKVQSYVRASLDLTKKSEITLAGVIPAELLAEKDWLQCKVMKSLPYDYFLIEHSPSARDYFVHFTPPQNRDLILQNGLQCNVTDEQENDLSFGKGIYCYKLDDRLIDLLKNFKGTLVPILFQIPTEYYHCVVDFEGMADGSGEYPPYYFSRQNIPALHIIRNITTCSDIINFYNETQVRGF